MTYTKVNCDCIMISFDRKIIIITIEEGVSGYYNISVLDIEKMVEIVPTIAIHGGAGTITRANMSAEMEAQYNAVLNQVLLGGMEVLKNGGTAMDAVCEAVRLMEESPLFNAGKGSVFTSDETHEMDASVMDGSNLKAGAVGGVQHIRNPVLAARAIMDKTRHVMLIGEGAERFIKSETDLEIVESSFFFTQNRLDQLHRAKAMKKEEEQQEQQEQKEKTKSSVVILDHDGANILALDRKYGTVGAVALDGNGNLAAATSTGGMTNKMPGRVGDSPIIGAGCYANNNSVAVSTTGVGETFMRTVASYDVSAQMLYGNKTLEDAASDVIFNKLPAVDGDGGLVAVDKHGNITMPFNTEGMYRGFIKLNEQPNVYIYK
ncbi:putative asparaginase 2 [Heterostelium album PN500]|uniref:beta-aspartyl-peptidase n=1 Tax=Heterostelium pallidum (strain ATCC 26659 / Pp 5 / PN500) TaxID=670386 RepID=D3BK97_HETP5|nr:putative asparaginase 2 [Heterostelium album PN500]EFA78327.1 putative asparaginase 2 [Heterostelium album PN500]|eukprot:XP_020430452.1 putative asparaginase 2 [Heterostelium album PN500]